MDWFQSKAAQIIGLVSIIGTLAGFGYTGATYVNRIENLEKKITKYVNETDSLADQLVKPIAILFSIYSFSPLKLFELPDVPAYNPNHAAPAPTTIDIKPDCSKEGSAKSINQKVVK